eukprot:CAMPEP_0119464476 /NCGR_PEP_ID=MMETSP1344-20130328/57_1 /TAXON_ID=236787 /ORGANISM="Florenciella parvula, Strain CCMP2471" /LENGTH=157 /DNA_ID=CAMNT_0007496685 /DNA_START=181 /DNA_END=652 /DNA_ORIENTATION=-
MSGKVAPLDAAMEGEPLGVAESGGGGCSNPPHIVTKHPSGLPGFKVPTLPTLEQEAPRDTARALEPVKPIKDGGSLRGVLEIAALSIMTGAAAGRQYYNYAMASEEVASLGVAFFLLAYISIANGVVAILFKMQTGMTIIGKDPKTGKLPLWSYIVW